jgi:hypothetical protein
VAKPKPKNKKIALRSDHPNPNGQAYEALAALNRNVEQVLADLGAARSAGLIAGSLGAPVRFAGPLGRRREPD